jgi:flagellar M-ring protein FliF
VIEQWKKIFGELSMTQRVTIGLATVVLLVGITGLTKWLQARDYKPLYTSMAPDDASAVVAKLKEDAIDYKLADNGTSVLVPSSRVDEVRLSLAGAGIPKSGRIGFELFDKANFGVTDFTEHVNYRRALEGELERSIKSLSAIDQARVHVTFPKESVFVESREAAKASVIVSIRTGAQLPPTSVTAIRYLISSAVEGLAPESVSVMDMRGNLLSRASRSGLDSSQISDATIEYQQKVEKQLLAKVNETLDPLVGSERFHASVSAECDFTSGEESHEEYDPDHSVMLSSAHTEDAVVTASTAGGGVPGTASALPNPTPRPANGGGGSSRKTETTQYQTSRTVKHIVYPQGGVTRLSVSVLLDNDVHWEGTGKKAKKTIVPPPPERIKVIRDLISAAVGLTPERGDQLIVESLPFEGTQNSDLVPSGGDATESNVNGFLINTDILMKMLKQPKILIGVGVAALLIVVLFVFALARLFKRPKRPRQIMVDVPRAIDGAPQAAEGGDHALPANQPSAVERQLQEHEAAEQKLLVEAQAKLKLPPPTSGKIEALVGHIRENVKKDPVMMANVLRSWVEESKQGR